MLKIAICDDNILDMNSINNMVELFFKKNEIKFEVFTFMDGSSLINSEIAFDIIFLDIQLKEENGLLIAKKLNEKALNFKLILVSHFTDYLKDGYKVNAARYFLKPLDKKEFMIEMESIVKDYLYQESFILDTRIHKRRIYIKTILYIEIIARKTYICTFDERIPTPYTLTQLSELVSDYCFTRTHKSFLVNMMNIRDYDNHRLVLLNSSTLPLSRFYKEDFINDFSKFTMERI